MGKGQLKYHVRSVVVIKIPLELENFGGAERHQGGALRAIGDWLLAVRATRRALDCAVRKLEPG